jgi:8-oxo-dGTP pyrophosphatase MutT (NUDIX family)
MSKPVFRIGMSGHQQLGDEATVTFVAEQVRELLMRYQKEVCQQDQTLIVSSALALGADRLFVRTALDLGIPVEIVLPCVDYESIFTTAEARAEYHDLLERCQGVHRLESDDCSDDAFLAAGHWLVDHSDLMVLAWNGLPAAGKGGTADIASYARLKRCPFVHINTRLHTTKLYGSPAPGRREAHTSLKREFAVSKETVYQGSVLRVNQYRFRMPDGQTVIRDIVERPESVLVLPVGQNGTVLMVEEYDIGAGNWQLTLPGGKVTDSTPDGIRKQAEIELREEIGYRPGRLEKLLDFYGHPGYMAHKVHLFVAYDLEWNPLEMEDGEEIQIKTLTLEEALAATKESYRCDPEASLALYLYKSS